jgi:hypothetical protein
MGNGPCSSETSACTGTRKLSFQRSHPRRVLRFGQTIELLTLSGYVIDKQHAVIALYPLGLDRTCRNRNILLEREIEKGFTGHANLVSLRNDFRSCADPGAGPRPRWPLLCRRRRWRR